MDGWMDGKNDAGHTAPGSLGRPCLGYFPKTLPAIAKYQQRQRRVDVGQDALITGHEHLSLRHNRAGNDPLVIGINQTKPEMALRPGCDQLIPQKPRDGFDLSFGHLCLAAQSRT